MVSSDIFLGRKISQKGIGKTSYKIPPPFLTWTLAASVFFENVRPKRRENNMVHLRFFNAFLCAYLCVCVYAIPPFFHFFGVVWWRFLCVFVCVCLRGTPFFFHIFCEAKTTSKNCHPPTPILVLIFFKIFWLLSFTYGFFVGEKIMCEKTRDQQIFPRKSECYYE